VLETEVQQKQAELAKVSKEYDKLKETEQQHKTK